MHRTRMAVGIALLLVVASSGIAFSQPVALPAGLDETSPGHRPAPARLLNQLPIGDVAPPHADDSFPPLENGLRAVWTELAPPRREGHSILYVPRDDRFIVIGQRADALWELRTRPEAAWSHLPTAGRAPAQCQAAVFDAEAHRAIVLGQDAAGRTGLWELRLAGRAQWKRLSDAPDTPSNGSAMAFDPNARRVLIAGSDGVWSVDVVSGEALQQVATIPLEERARLQSSAVFDDRRNTLLLVDDVGRLYRLDLSGEPVWAGTTEGFAYSSYFHSVCLMLDRSTDEAIVIEGGQGTIVAVSLATGEIRTLTSQDRMPFDTRSSFAAAFDPIARDVLVHGGAIWCRMQVSDMVGWNVDAGGWRTIGPEGGFHRWNFKSVIDPIRDRLLMYFAKERFGGPDDDVQILDLGSPHAGLRTLPAMAGSEQEWTPALPGDVYFDTKRDRAFLLGRENETGPVRMFRTTTTGGSDWKSAPLGGGGPTDINVLFHDEEKDRLIVAEGPFVLTFVGSDRLWELALSTLEWRRLEYRGKPLPFHYGKVFYDARRKAAWFTLLGDSVYKMHFESEPVTTTGYEIENGYLVYPFSPRLHDDVHQRILGFSIPPAWGVAREPQLHSNIVTLELSPQPRWVRHATEGPNPGLRGDYTFALDRKRDRLIIHGGYDDECLYFTESYALSLQGLGPGRGTHRAEVPETQVLDKAAEPLGAAFHLKTSWPGATASGPLEVRFSLPAADPARLDLIDLQGRRIAGREVRAGASGQGRITLSETALLKPGVYFVRLQQGGVQKTARIAVLQ